MKCPSKNRRQITDDRGQKAPARRGRPSSAFTLVESMAAAALLAFIGASVWLVTERSMLSAADFTQRMRAFEIARNNMETLLGSTSVEEGTEYGVSEQFPDIRWQTTINTFYEPSSGLLWAQAICSAEYTDSASETKSVELTHWLTNLSSEQTRQLTMIKQLLEKKAAGYIIETEELAAQYEGVSVETIQTWARNGMPTYDGAFIIPWLDLYLQTEGNPTPQDKQYIKTKYPELSALGGSAAKAGTAKDKTSPAQNRDDSGEEMTPQTPDDSEPVELPENINPELKEKLKQLLGK
jgi:type II secretory pathway pseudopilin PulG